MPLTSSVSYFFFTLWKKLRGRGLAALSLLYVSNRAGRHRPSAYSKPLTFTVRPSFAIRGFDFALTLLFVCSSCACVSAASLAGLSEANLFHSVVNQEHGISFALTKISSGRCQRPKITSGPAKVIRGSASEAMEHVFTRSD